MPETLLARLKRSARLPTPPGTALEILRLCQQDDISISALSDTLAAEFTYCNILLESARPLQKAEVPGSITGKWMDHWLSRLGPEWVEAQLLSPRQWVRLQAQWEGRRVNPGTLYYSPQAMGVVGKALSSFVA